MRLTIIILLVALPAFGQSTMSFNGPVPPTPQPPVGSQELNFANVTTGVIVPQLPSAITNTDLSVVSNPDSNTLASVGWRTVQSVQAPTNATYSASQFSIQDLGNGWCNLVVTNVYNVTTSSDAVITNSIYWSPTFITTLQLYRSIMRAYQGQSGETNIVSTVTIAKFLGQNPTWYTGTNAANMTLELLTANNILLYYPQYTNTMQWWQQNGHLVP